ncbi:MAG TPA: phosphohistidine phosphatase SixA, partial [Nitrososphaeraceae archaeon]|nr:phosphohistidine phosphatase SixA [Nitrososphaeraceae archaeon]
MLNLIILRHGEAGTRLSDPVNDYQRPLTQPGKKEVMQVAKSLKKLHVKFDYIFSSPLVRTFETAKIVATHYNLIEKIELSDELKPSGNNGILYDKLKKLNIDSTILIVGHEPYLSSMISDIISNNSYNENRINIILKKAGLSKIKITSTVPRLKGELSWLLTPKILKKVVKP